jgi:RHS repeat-associated protein
VGTCILNDHLGTPQQLITPSGTVAWQAAYLPYGEAQVQPGNTITNNLGFPGQYFDVETGLQYNWNRYYDPATGRYLSADPIGLEGGINLYAYVGGNPVNWSDPEGLVPLAIPFFVGKVIEFGGIVIGSSIGIISGLWVYDYWFANENTDEDCENVKRPPPGSKPINETPWSGDH